MQESHFLKVQWKAKPIGIAANSDTFIATSKFDSAAAAVHCHSCVYLKQHLPHETQTETVQYKSQAVKMLEFS